MRVEAVPIPGCFELVAQRHDDRRGFFVKTYQERQFRELGLCTRFREDFFTRSHRDVLRGLHLQRPPAALSKLVHVLAGEVFDALVDLRPGSPTRGRHYCRRLSEREPRMLYVAPGVAHGFLVLSESALLGYKVSAEHAPECDVGVRWDSAGIPWPTRSPVLSDRDAALPPLEQFGEYDWS